VAASPLVEKTMDETWAEQKRTGFLNSLPGYSGYRDKENRRDADKAVRNRLVDELATRAKRVESIATSLANQRRISEVGPVNDLATEIRYLRDRINTASYGYGGLFSNRDINAAVLDQIRLFDESLFASLDRIDAALSAIDLSVSSGGDIAATAAAAKATLNEANGRFDLRSRVVESAAPASPEEMSSALDVLKTPEERKAAASPPAAYELHDRDAIAVLGDNYVVDARIDIEASSGFFRIFRIDVAPDRWLLVPKVRDQPFATLIASKDAYSPAATPTIGDSTFLVEASGHGSGDLVGVGGQTGRLPLAYTLLRGESEPSKRAVVLQWGTEQQILVGNEVHPDDIEIFGKPT